VAIWANSGELPGLEPQYTQMEKAGSALLLARFEVVMGASKEVQR
jgi:hypothetical protein